MQDWGNAMKNFTLHTLLLAFLCALCCVPARAQQPVYGGVFSPVYVTTKETFYVQGTSENSLANISCASTIVSYRMKLTDGLIFQDQFTISTGSANGSGVLFPYEGWLLSATVGCVSPSVSGLYIQIMILNTPVTGMSRGTQGAPGFPNSNIIEQVLFAGCISSFYTYSWPSAQATPPTACAAQNASRAVTNPAAGAQFTQALEQFGRERIINIRFTVTTSAVAASRDVCVNFLKGGVAGTVVGSACSPFFQVASQTVTYNFMAGIGATPNCSLIGATQTAIACSEVEVPLPTYWESVTSMETSIGAPFSINSNVKSIDVGDTITAISIREQLWNETN